MVNEMNDANGTPDGTIHRTLSNIGILMVKPGRGKHCPVPIMDTSLL